jgi:GTP-binding protein Era
MPFKSGYVTVLGRPNSGKSTLVNALVGRKVAIVSPKPQTTRLRIQGIVNRENAQIVLTDTPGIHKPASALNQQMMEEVQQSLDGVDILALVADASVDFGAGDRYALDWVRRFHGKSFLILNKIDLFRDKRKLLPRIEIYSRDHTFTEIFPVSALTGNGMPALEKSLIDHLPEGVPFFPQDQFTDQPERFLAAELVREKAILKTREELPHAIAVLVDTYEETEKLLHIRATLYVEREGQKGIVIGKGGLMLKQIGTEARLELESMLGAKIFLELYVKVLPNWRDNPAIVRQLDWHRQLEQLSEER